jgi:Carbohydrate binding module (family 6)
MKYRKTPIALGVVALCASLPLGSQTASITMEAESMSLSTYTAESTRIRVPSGTSTGTATKAFNGASGTYNIQVFVVPEDDGRPTLELHKGATKLQTYTYPQQSAAASFTVNNVALASGEAIKLVGTGNGGAYARVDKIVFTPVAAATSTPYSGTPIALPKAFEAANFDKGGQNVAYKDLTVGNDGNQYRTGEDVDIVASSDSAGGAYAVRNFQAGEWMNYTVNVPSSGNYDLAVRVANTLSTPPSFHIEVDGVNVSGALSVPNTGSSSSFQWVGKQGVALSAGKRIVKVVADQQQFSVNSISVLASATTPPIIGDGVGSVSPVTVEAESMTLSTYSSEGSRIRLPSGTATGTATKPFGGASGKYDMQVHVLPESDGRPTLEVHKGSTRLTTYTYPQQTSATSFKVSGVTLSQGEQIKLVGKGNGGAYARVDKIVLTPSSASTPPPAPDPVGTPTEPSPVTGACANPSSGYEGFGRNTTGGAGKTLYRVTTLNDSGSGSLRDAISQGNRCVVFDVGGTISLGSNLSVKGANITIDGFTAPSPGITLKNRALVMDSSAASNVVVRGVRSRGTASGEDAMRVRNASNVVFDRVSITGFGDGAIDVTDNARDVTIQWSILGDGLPSHNFVNLIANGGRRVTLHHNLYVNGVDRLPKCAGASGASSVSADTTCDVRNNLIWNFKQRATNVSLYGSANVVNNYYHTTTASQSQSVQVGEGGSAYVSGNISHGGANVNGIGNRSTPYTAVTLATTDALTAAQQVLAHAGARGPRFTLDSVDQGYIKNISLGAH